MVTIAFIALVIAVEAKVKIIVLSLANQSRFYCIINEIKKEAILDNLPNYAFEDIKYYAFESQPENLETLPVYRMLNSDTGAHLFTVDSNEVNHIQNNLPNYSLEGDSGVAFYVFALE